MPDAAVPAVTRDNGRRAREDRQADATIIFATICKRAA
jgi:hypothetical protein